MTAGDPVLDALFAHAPAGLAVLDRELRYLRVNDRLAEINGLPAADHVGRTPAEVLDGDLGERVHELMRQALATGQAIEDLRVNRTSAAESADDRHFIATYLPVAGTGVLSVVAEVTAERRAAERAAAAGRLLDAVYAATPVGLAFWSPELRYLRINEELARINGRPVAAHIGRSITEVLGDFGAELEQMLRRVMETHEAIEQTVEFRGGFYEVNYYPVAATDGGLLGVGGVVHDVSHRHAAESERAQLLKDALVARAQAEAAQVRVEEALRVAEAARARTAFLAEAGRRLASSMDIGETLQRVADLAVPRVAEWCAITLVADSRLEHVAVAHADPALRARVTEFARRYPPDPQAPTGAAEVVRTGQMQLLNEIPDEMLQIVAHDEEHLAMLRELGMRAALIVPLATPRRPIGALTLIRGEDYPAFSDDDVELARALASRAALHINNARLYSERTHIARTLQAALLPRRLAEIPGVEVAASYAAAGDQNEVGGDFYDVFALQDGAYAAIIGDVSGKGPEAAAVTSLARHTLRTLLGTGAGLVEAFGALNAAVLEQASERFCTVAALRVEPDGEGAALEVAVGGHPEPLIRRADGRVEPVAATGTLIGALPEVHFQTARVRLAPADLMLLYTDGLVELRGRSPEFGERWLPGALERSGGSGLDALLGTLQDCAVELQGGIARDDIAILALRAKS